MPATIVLVHDDIHFLRDMSDRFLAVGRLVAPFDSSMDAVGLLQGSDDIELLITRIRFKPGTPSGDALARMAKYNRPRIKVLFVALPQTQEYTWDLGVFLPMPASASEVVAAANNLLAARQGAN